MECAPANPLSQLSKAYVKDQHSVSTASLCLHFELTRSPQDHFSAAGPSESRNTARNSRSSICLHETANPPILQFRQTPADLAGDADANAFFAHRADDTFDLADFHQSLDDSFSLKHFQSRDWASSFAATSATFRPASHPAQHASFERAFAKTHLTYFQDGAVLEPSPAELVHVSRDAPRLVPPPVAAWSWQGSGSQHLLQSSMKYSTSSLCVCF